MLWDPTYKPFLRPVEPFPVPDGDDGQIAVRDRSGLSDVVLTVSRPALYVLALMDGANTCEDIRRTFQESFGQSLSVDTLQSMLEGLEQAHLLEGPGFESFYQSRQEAYRQAGVREMPHAAQLGIVDASGDLFEDMLRGVEPPALSGPVRGLVTPHLDYLRGRPCYAVAYATLRNRPAPDRVVILGTNHAGRALSVVSTACDFATPLGTTRLDRAFLERMEARCGDLRACELDHLREHSVELQVAWLQHLFGATSFEMVPFLCPDPCGPTGTAPPDGRGTDLRDFACILGELIEQDARDTLLVAGADLSHIGPAFGDQRTLDQRYREEVRRHDHQALERLVGNDPAGFVRFLAECRNRTNVCSAGCVFALATALPDATVTVLGYHQAVDEAAQRCVTCTAVALT